MCVPHKLGAGCCRVVNGVSSWAGRLNCEQVVYKPSYLMFVYSSQCCKAPRHTVCNRAV
jgi:hypothetical protein